MGPPKGLSPSFDNEEEKLKRLNLAMALATEHLHNAESTRMSTCLSQTKTERGPRRVKHIDAGSIISSFGLPLKIHLSCVLAAVPLGAWLLARKIGGSAHRFVGRTWAAVMVGAAISSFGLRDIRDPMYKGRWGAPTQQSAHFSSSNGINSISGDDKDEKETASLIVLPKKSSASLPQSCLVSGGESNFQGGLTSFLEPFTGLGPVHLLSTWALATIPQGILSARAKDIKTHARVMRWNFIGLAGAGYCFMLATAIGYCKRIQVY